MFDEIVELEFTGMAGEGMALARHEGRVWFVPFGVPGEHARVRLTRDKGRFAFGEIVDSIGAPAAIRVEPRCQYFGVCGGCDWQHIDYGAQLTFKHQAVIDALTRVGGIEAPLVHPTLPSPDVYDYRTHITLHRAADGLHGGFIGVEIPLEDDYVVPIERCEIARPEIREMLVDPTLAEVFRPLQWWGRVRLQLGSDPAERLRVVVAGEKASDLPADDEAVASPQAVKAAKPPLARYTIHGRDFYVTGGSFFQVNLAQAAALVTYALDRLHLTGMERTLDLFSGVGLFTAFMAENAAHVTAIESYAPAVKDARRNLEGFDNVLLVEGTIEEALPKLRGTFEIALADPPRSGFPRRALDALIARAPRRIVYVSCNPQSLARDAKLLIAAGYRLIDAQPIDMFPQTYHIEIVAQFEK